MRISQFLIVSMLAVFSSMVLAAADNSEVLIRKTLDSLQLQVPIESIRKTPMNNLYEVALSGGKILYVSGDGQFVLQGNLFQTQKDSLVNLTEKAESKGIAKLIDQVKVKDMVVFPAKGKTKAHITVFSDTTCPYCARLHKEVPKLNELGVEVRYMAFPRQGLKSSGDKQLQAVWCSKDRNDALTRMFKGEDIKAPSCDNPVASQYNLGRSIGVSGTPAIILANGKLVAGYLEASKLSALIFNKPE